MPEIRPPSMHRVFVEFTLVNPESGRDHLDTGALLELMKKLVQDRLKEAGGFALAGDFQVLAKHIPLVVKGGGDA